MSLPFTPLWTAEEAAKASAGQAFGSWQAEGVSIDSRQIQPGDLFVAISGPSHDGHSFVENVMEAGAAAAVIVKKRLDETLYSKYRTRLLCVEDTVKALEGLARAARQRTAAKIVAVTGSVGKTGTKEMLRMVLAEQGLTTATVGNLNNHFGLPLSLSRMHQNTEFGVFELGMSAAGEISPLSEMVRPDVAIITAIEYAHSAFFDTIEEIADAKAEIFSGLGPSGIAVLNADNAMIERLKASAEKAGIRDVRTFGSAADCDCQLKSVEMKASSSIVSAELRGQLIEFEISVPGRHWVQNALAVLCAVDALGADPVQAAAMLAEMQGLKGRGRLHTLSISGGVFQLIDESYNASPASMRAAIGVLGNAQTSDDGRRIAVLGDMLELGDQADKLHAELADVLRDNNIDLVFTTGQLMSFLWDALPSEMRGGHAREAQELFPLIRSVVRPSDVVMVKGSNGARTGLIVEDLLKLELDIVPDNTTAYAVNGN